MIVLDRTSPLPVAEQLVEGLRYHVAAGRWRVGDRLPATRDLAAQIGLSYHTVRKAYARLAGEGVLEVRRGGGYHVAERAAPSAAEQREKGGSVVQDALQKLVGLGFNEEEAALLFEEQLQFFESPAVRRKVLVAAPWREQAEALAESVAGALQERVEAVTLAELARHPDADLVVAPMPTLTAARTAAPSADVEGVLVRHAHAFLERIARLGPADTLGVAARTRDAGEPLLAELRALAGFAGPALLFPPDAERRQLEGLVQQADLVVFTVGMRRRLRPLLDGKPHVEYAPTVAPESLARLRDGAGR